MLLSDVPGHVCTGKSGFLRITRDVILGDTGIGNTRQIKESQLQGLLFISFGMGASTLSYVEASQKHTLRR